MGFECQWVIEGSIEGSTKEWRHDCRVCDYGGCPHYDSANSGKPYKLGPLMDYTPSKKTMEIFKREKRKAEEKAGIRLTSS